MSECMKIGWSNRTALQYALEVVLHTSRLYPLMFFSGQKEFLRGFRLDRGKELCEIFRQRNHTDRMLAFRRGNHYLRLLIGRHVGLDSLHGVLHIFSQRRAQSSPTRMPVNKHSKIPAFLSEKFAKRYRHKAACSLCVNTRISVCSCRTVTVCKSQETEISNLTAKCSMLLRRKTAAVTVPAERPLFLTPPETRSSVQNDSMC